MEAIWKTTRIIGLTCCLGLLAAVSVDRADGTDKQSGQVSEPQEVVKSLTPALQTVDGVPNIGNAAVPESTGHRTTQGGGNDDCTTPQMIGDGPTAYSTVGNNTDGVAHEGCLSDGQTWHDDWFSHIASCTGDLTVSTCGDADYDSDIVVYAGYYPVDWACPPGIDEFLGCNDDAAGCAGFTSELTVAVTAGDWLTIRVGGWQDGDMGTGNLTLTCAEQQGPPANDDCAGATAVTDGSTDFDNAGATLDGTAPAPCDVNMEEDIWFLYTATCDGEATIASGCDDDPTPDTTLEVFGEGTCPPSSTLGCADDNCGISTGFASTVTVPVLAGNGYLIRIGGWNSGAAAGHLVISCETPPDFPPCGVGAGGEDCDSATVIPELPCLGATGNTCDAADDYNEICPFGSLGGRDVVYQYTPTQDQECYDFSLCNSDYDTKLYIYENECGANPIACDDDTAGCGIFASELLSVPLTGGNTYYIVVDGFNALPGSCGDYQLDITPATCPPPNDDCANRIDIFDGDTAFGTAGATTDGVPNHPGCVLTANDIWYNYDATCTGSLIVSTCNQADYDSAIVIYGSLGGLGGQACDTANCPPGDEFVDACNDDGSGCGATSLAAASVVEGECLKIRVGGFAEGNVGTGTITVTCSDPFCGDSICGDGEDCQNCEADCGRCCGADGDGDGDLCDESLGEFCANCGPDCGACADPECPLTSCSCGDCFVTQSAFPDTAAVAQVACASGNGTTDNGWARCFNLADEGVTGDLTISSVTFGVQQATKEDITVQVLIYTDSDGCPPSSPGEGGDATLIASASTVVGSADEGTFITLDFPGVVIPAGTDVIVEVYQPENGSVPAPDGFFFRSMANFGGQCASNYLRAALCGIPGWIAMDAIGFPTRHLVLNINGGDEVPAETLIIKQGACPAPVNPNSNGVIPMVLVGSESFDVNDVDQTTLLLRRCDGSGDPWAPLADHTFVEDLNHPGGPVECGGCQCNDDQSSDGIDDLSMKFGTDATLAALGIGVGDGVVTVELSGNLLDGTSFCSALDCLVVVPPGSGTINATFESNVLDTLLEVTPMDLNLDIDGFADFSRAYIEGTMVTLKAPITSDGRRFLRWSVNGELQGFGIRTIEVTIGADTALKAFYQRRGRVVPELPSEGSGDMD
ncbi:MAG: hypothetical protein O7D91_18195 [Planctomycetota bacterium]|nr:hypothetical protein [Planctomycetota bacterium]